MTTQTITKEAPRTLDNAVEQEAASVMSVVAKSNGGPSLERELNMIGAQALTRAKSTREMMASSVNAALPSLSKDSEIATILNEATLRASELNPNNVTSSMLFKIPFKPLRTYLMKQYVRNFQSESSKVENIFDSLEEAKENLLTKMIQLEEQYVSLRETYKELDHNIAVGKSVQVHLDGMDTSAMDELEARKYDSAQNKVARRLRDLETIKIAISQFFVSIDQTMNVQTQLSETIDSVRTVGPIVLQNAIMISSAIDEQRKVTAAVKSTQDSLSEALAANARNVKGNAQAIAELYNNPVLAMDKMKASFKDLEDAISISLKAQNESTQKARDMTTEMEKMNAAFAPVAETLNERVVNPSDDAPRLEKQPGGQE